MVYLSVSGSSSLGAVSGFTAKFVSSSLGLVSELSFYLISTCSLVSDDSILSSILASSIIEGAFYLQISDIMSFKHATGWDIASKNGINIPC